MLSENLSTMSFWYYRLLQKSLHLSCPARNPEHVPARRRVIIGRPPPQSAGVYTPLISLKQRTVRAARRGRDADPNCLDLINPRRGICIIALVELPKGGAVVWTKGGQMDVAECAVMGWLE